MSISLDNFILPDEATAAFKKHNMQPSKLGDGIDFFISHDAGMAYEFFTEQIRNERKSKLAGYPVFDEIEMIRWYKDRFDKPTEQVRFLPEELLSFNEYGELVGGRFKDAYSRFKSGTATPGLSLARWEVLGKSEVATLSAMNIFSVEQFAATPLNRIAGKLPKDPYVNAHELAVQYVNGKDVRALNAKQTEQIVAVADENVKLKQQLEALQEQMKSLLTGGSKKAKKKEEEEVITDSED